MPKLKNKTYKPPVKIHELIQTNYQRYYLNYINELIPEIQESLKKLTPQCVSLFGTFPNSDETKVVSEFLKSEFWRVFDICIWNESRGNHGANEWVKLLSENNDFLKRVLEKEEIFNNKANEFIDNSNSEALDELRETAPEYFTKPKESISLNELKHVFRSEIKKSYKKGDFIHELINTKYNLLEPLKMFQNDFDLVLRKFFLEKEWSAIAVFEAIWDGTGILKHAGFVEKTDQAIISQIKNKLGKTIGNENDISNEYNLFENIEIPLPNPFIYEEPYSILIDFKDYQKRAISSYKDHLHNYYEIIKEVYVNSSLTKTRKSIDYSRLKWLISWNLEGKTKDEILQEIADTTDQYKSLDIIDSAFRQFRQYDLPIRPTKMN